MNIFDFEFKLVLFNEVSKLSIFFDFDVFYVSKSYNLKFFEILRLSYPKFSIESIFDLRFNEIEHRLIITLVQTLLLIYN